VSQGFGYASSQTVASSRIPQYTLDLALRPQADLKLEATADPQARISHRQRLAIYRNAHRLAKRSDIGLLAGARQRISDKDPISKAACQGRALPGAKGEACRLGFSY
jgi:hypothetical protein